MPHVVDKKKVTAKIAATKKSKHKEPPLYDVILLNDDFTPMDFVIQVLLMFFAMQQTEAVRVMLTVHNKDKAVCGTYPKDIAISKIAQVVQFARSHKHPLQCIMEENK